eukprot:1376952-Amphidinium_carterae.1
MASGTLWEISSRSGLRIRCRALDSCTLFGVCDKPVIRGNSTTYCDIEVCMVQMLTNNIPPVGARTGHDGGIFLNGCFTLPDIKKATLERCPFGVVLRYQGYPIPSRFPHTSGTSCSSCSWALTDCQIAHPGCRPVSFHLIPRGLAGIQSLAQGLLEKAAAVTKNM